MRSARAKTEGLSIGSKVRQNRTRSCMKGGYGESSGMLYLPLRIPSDDSAANGSLQNNENNSKIGCKFFSRDVRSLFAKTTTSIKMQTPRPKRFSWKMIWKKRENIFLSEHKQPWKSQRRESRTCWTSRRRGRNPKPTHPLAGSKLSQHTSHTSPAPGRPETNTVVFSPLRRHKCEIDFCHKQSQFYSRNICFNITTDNIFKLNPYFPNRTWIKKCRKFEKAKNQVKIWPSSIISCLLAKTLLIVEQLLKWERFSKQRNVLCAHPKSHNLKQPSDPRRMFWSQFLKGITHQSGGGFYFQFYISVGNRGLLCMEMSNSSNGVTKNFHNFRRCQTPALLSSLLENRRDIVHTQLQQH